jgi:type IV secretion system protein VirD4
MAPDELKSIPKGNFVVMKTGTHPMQTQLRLYLDWGITFGEPYLVPEKTARLVAYANKQELEQNIFARYLQSGTSNDEPSPSTPNKQAEEKQDGHRSRIKV